MNTAIGCIIIIIIMHIVHPIQAIQRESQQQRCRTIIFIPSDHPTAPTLIIITTTTATAMRIIRHVIIITIRHPIWTLWEWPLSELQPLLKCSIMTNSLITHTHQHRIISIIILVDPWWPRPPMHFQLKVERSSSSSHRSTFSLSSQVSIWWVQAHQASASTIRTWKIHQHRHLGTPIIICRADQYGSNGHVHRARREEVQTTVQPSLSSFRSLSIKCFFCNYSSCSIAIGFTRLPLSHLRSWKVSIHWSCRYFSRSFHPSEYMIFHIIRAYVFFFFSSLITFIWLQQILFIFNGLAHLLEMTERCASYHSYRSVIFIAKPSSFQYTTRVCFLLPLSDHLVYIAL